MSRRRERVVAVDAIRGAAVAAMIAVHALAMFGTARAQTTGAAHLLLQLGKLMAAPFLVCMGISAALARSRQPADAARRALGLLAFAYLLNALKFLVPMQLLSGLPDALLRDVGLTPGAPENWRFFLLLGDILHTSALALLLLALLSLLRVGSAVALTLAALVAAVSPLLSGLGGGGPLVRYLCALAFSDRYDVFFPLFPWLAPALAGYGLGRQLAGAKVLRALYDRWLVAGLLLAVAGFGVGRVWPALWQGSSAYRPGPACVAVLLGTTLTFFRPAELVWTHVPLLRTPFAYLSRRVTSLYAISWVLICWSLGPVGFMTFDGTAALGVIVLTTLAGSLAVDWLWRRAGAVLMTCALLLLFPVRAAAQDAPPRSASRSFEVVVRGANEAQRLQQSADAVNVVETRKAKQQTADLGEVLARTQGVAVRRDGGLGSSAHFSLNGLYDDQIRFFLDGVPLELAGYPFGIANVPVNLIERAEVYRGVVPVRLGVDALGGAINLVTNQSLRPRLSVSYQVGSFGTHRLTVDGHYHHRRTGLVAGVTGFLDIAENNYSVDVEVPDKTGRLFAATVPRFHDGYRAYGGTVEAGVRDRPWARRLLISGFASTYYKELQHNVVMTVPYGEVAYGETLFGATARYDVALRENVELELIANYSHRIIDFVDRAKWVYDWYGQRIRARQVPGELDARPYDQTVWHDSGFGRALLKWTVKPDHVLRLSLSPTYTSRSGEEHLKTDPSARDPLSARRQLFTLVSGLEYELSLFRDRLSNVVFVKNYVYRADTEELLPSGTYREQQRQSLSAGAGDSLRLRLSSWLYAKASYEYATRLPRPDEVFGNGVLVLANLQLEPEVSHNANLGPRIELRRSRIGELTADVNAFLRDSDRLIVLLGSDRTFLYQNVYRARAFGVEGALSWVSPGRWLTLDGSLTWQDVRNVSSEGTFADFEGDRIPNRPWLFASWGARLRIPKLPRFDDTLEPFYSGRFVSSFFRGWESQGLREFKQVVDTQVMHNLGVTWNVLRPGARFGVTFEVDNVGDAKLFDNFGVQRPGRSFFLKLTGES